MSEERFDQAESKDEDVEGHRHTRMGNEELGSEESDDVEGHRHTRMGTDEPAAEDDTDDVEAHRRQA